MDFILKRTKTWTFISIFCFGLALLTLFSGFISTLGYWADVRRAEAAIALAVVGLFMNILVFGVFLANAFLTWKKGPNKLLFLICSGAMLMQMFVMFIAEIIVTIANSYYSFNFAGLFLGNMLPFLLAAYMVVFTFLKLDGPIVPIIGAGIAGTALVTQFFSGFGSFISYLVILFKDFDFRNILGVGNVLNSAISSLAFWAGVLLLVPLAFYQPKKNSPSDPVCRDEFPVIEKL